MMEDFTFGKDIDESLPLTNKIAIFQARTVYLQDLWNICDIFLKSLWESSYHHKRRGEITALYNYHLSKGNAFKNLSEKYEDTTFMKKDAVINFNAKMVSNLVDEYIPEKFNHSEMIQYIKKESIKQGGNKLWLKNLGELRGYILLTQSDVVINELLVDFVEYFKDKSIKSNFFQNFLEVVRKNTLLSSAILERKDNYLKIFKDGLNIIDGSLKDLIITVINVVDDNDFKELIPQKDNNHILFQKGNNIVPSEVWSLDYKVLNNTLALSAGKISKVLTYNVFMTSFIHMLNDLGWKVHLLQRFNGSDATIKMLINIIPDVVDGQKIEDIQNFFDFLVLRVENKQSFGITFSDYVNGSAYDTKFRSNFIENVMRKEYELFVLDKMVPEKVAGKGSINKH